MILERMSDDLKLTKKQIEKIIGNGASYKKYKIAKVNGGERTISHPSKELKVLQTWVNRNIMKEFPVSPYSTAYETGNSVAKNALKHCNNNFILHTDIEHFFESLTSAHLIKLFESTATSQYSSEDIRLVIRIIFFKDRLAIGSVSAPAVANRIMYYFDNMVAERLKSEGEFIYTRYSDDIVISSKKHIPEEILNIVDDELHSMGLKRNFSKTYFGSKKQKRQINGIILDNNSSKITYGCEKLAKLKKEIYLFVIKKAYDENEKQQLLGKLAFLKDINQDQYQSIVDKYSQYKYASNLFKINKEG